jgi:DNA sulfur modification protein DndB
MTKLSGLGSGEDLKPIFNERSKPFDEKSVSAATADALDLKIEAEVADGWALAKRSKRTARLQKPKPVDRQLEDDVWSLLHRMGFKELNEDRQFKIVVQPNAPARQIDVFAKDDETVFIVECTHSQEAGAKSLKALIDKINGMREDVIKAVHSHYGKGPKLKVKFAIATRNIEWRKADKIRAAESRIPIITEDDLRYFEKLTDLLKHAARFQFLGRYFRGEKVEGLRVRVPATRGRAGNRTFYNFLMSPHELLRIAYISHRSTTTNDDLETYQRMVKPARLKAIGKFIDEGGKFPTNVVVNFKAEGSLNFDVDGTFGDTNTGSLHLPGLYGSAWIIDGQHRLYGYAHAERPAEEDHTVVPVLAYENLPIREEIELFIDINTQQVKVSRNLVNEIFSSLNITDEDPRKRLEALCARTALRLDAYPSSPIRNRILTVSQDKDNFRCLTLTSLADGISENSLLGSLFRVSKEQTTILPGSLSDLSNEPQATMDKAVAALSQYLRLFSDKLETHWQLGDAKGGYLCTNLGLRALLQLFRRLVMFVEASQHVRANTLSAEDLVQRLEPYVAKLVDYFLLASTNDINSFRSRGSSLVSVDRNCMQMMSIIHEAMPTFTTPEIAVYMESRDSEGTKQAKDMVDEINRIIFDDVLAELREKYGTVKDAWWLQGVPKSVRNECDRNYNEGDGKHDRWQYLYLINYVEILLNGENWDLFKDRYNFYGKGKKADLIRWIVRLNKARQITHHAEKGPLSKEEVQFVRDVYQLVKTHIEGGESVIPNRRYLYDPGETPPPEVAQ